MHEGDTPRRPGHRPAAGPRRPGSPPALAARPARTPRPADPAETGSRSPPQRPTPGGCPRPGHLPGTGSAQHIRGHRGRPSRPPPAPTPPTGPDQPRVHRRPQILPRVNGLPPLRAANCAINSAETAAPPNCAASSCPTAASSERTQLHPGVDHGSRSAVKHLPAPADWSGRHGRWRPPAAACQPDPRPVGAALAACSRPATAHRPGTRSRRRSAGPARPGTWPPCRELLLPILVPAAPRTASSSSARAGDSVPQERHRRRRGPDPLQRPSSRRLRHPVHRAQIRAAPPHAAAPTASPHRMPTCPAARRPRPPGPPPRIPHQATLPGTGGTQTNASRPVTRPCLSATDQQLGQAPLPRPRWGPPPAPPPRHREASETAVDRRSAATGPSQRTTPPRSDIGHRDP